MKKIVLLATFSGSLICPSLVWGQAGAGAGTASTSAAVASGPVRSSSIATRSAATASTPVPRAPTPLTTPASAQAPGVAPGGAIGVTPAAPGLTPSGVVPGPVNGAPIATTPQVGVTFNALPAAVQSAITAQSGGAPVGAISQAMTANGPIYTVSVNQNGTPMEMSFNSAGAVIPTGQNIGGASTSANTFAVAPGSASSQALATAQAGLPLSSLPAAVQNSISSQLGNNGSVQAVSRDETANGTVYRVTANQNGVPTEMQFAANGNLLSTTPLNGAITSTFGTAPGLAAATPLIAGAGTPLVFEDLPVPVQTAIRSQTGGLPIDGITQQNTTNGMAYNVRFTRNGRPQSLLVGGNGQILASNGMRTNVVAAVTNATPALTINDLPEAVVATLKKEAPEAQIRNIRKERGIAGDVYKVGFRANDRYTELAIDSKGKILRDSRDVAVVVKSKPVVTEDATPKLNYSSLPVAVKDAVKAYAPASDVTSVEFTSRDGKPVYEVVYHDGARRDRLVLAKDGSLIERQQNVPPAVEAGGPVAPVLAIGDLPQAVQDTIRRQTSNNRVKEINPTEVGGKSLYEVKWQTNGTPQRLLIASDGAVVFPEGAPLNEPAGNVAPPPVLRDEKKELTRTIDASPKPAAIGNAATAEVGTESSTTVAAPTSTVKLEQMPVAAQNTVKKLAGSSLISSITPTIKDIGIVYEVKVMQDGKERTLLVDKDGKVLQK